MTRRAALLLAILVTLAADIATKAAAVRYLADTAMPLGDYLRLRLVYNSGVAFGFGSGTSTAVIVVLTGTAVATLAVMAWRGTLEPPAPAGMAVGGGLANLADRITGGTVVDMFDLGWWPVFNLADVLLISGVTLIATLASRAKPSTDGRRGAYGMK